MKKLTTKDKIKKASIKLFNKKDTQIVTTNHIAKEADISPGNLYYHYKNKEEIIIEIYKDMSIEFDKYKGFENILSSKNPLKVLSDIFDSYNKLFLKYKFLIRDTTILMNIYPELKKIFSKKQEERLLQIESVLKYLISENILKNIEEEELPTRAKLCWFICAYWQNFINTINQVDKESISEIKELVFKTQIYPYLSEKGKELLKQMSN